MRINHVLLACKRTAWEHFGDGTENARRALGLEDMAIIEESHRNHYATLNHIKAILDATKISYRQIYPYGASREAFQNCDLVISVGGDGTLLHAASNIYDSTPLLPVKSDKQSYGALCTIHNCTYFAEILHKILHDDIHVEKWTRVNGQWGSTRDVALNEILVGPLYRSQQARYQLCIGSECEEQIGGGVIITTGAGSTGWYSNIAGNHGHFDRTSSELRFIITEYKSHADYHLIKGTIHKGEVFEIRSKMNLNGIVSFDGDCDKRIYSFPRGETISISISEFPLHVIVEP